MTRVVTMGETMAVFAASRVGPAQHVDSWSLGIGGSESNLAVGLVRQGIPATWLGRVGDDSFGRLVLSRLRGEGVNVDHVVVDREAPTGLMVKERRTSSQTTVFYYRAGSAGSRIAPRDLVRPVIEEADMLHVSAITPALSESAREATLAAIRMARDAGTLVSVDLNYRNGLWTQKEAEPVLRTLVSSAEILFATEAEANMLVRSSDAVTAAKALGELGPTEVMVKRGAEGVIALIEGSVRTVAAHPVNEVDPVGAGDAFSAGYLAARLQNSPPEERLTLATRVAAWVVGVPGDWEGLPWAGEVAAPTDTDNTNR